MYYSHKLVVHVMRTDNSRVYLVGNLEIMKMYKKRFVNVNITTLSTSQK